MKTLIAIVLFIFSFLVTVPATASCPKDSGRVCASWYGPGFYGNKMANGKKLYRGLVAVAAPKEVYQLGTMLKVTNLMNGQSITVVVMDRGPYRKDGKPVLLDLTEAAAKKIDMIEPGLVPISHRVISSP